MKFLLLNGSIRPSPLANHAEMLYLKSLANHANCIEVLRLAELSAELGNAENLQTAGDKVLQAYQQLLEADAIFLLVQAYRTSYPGLFKHFFDLLDQTALRGKLAALCTLGQGKECDVAQQQLHPLLDYFGVFVLPMEIFVHLNQNTVMAQDGQLSLNQDIQRRIPFQVQQVLSLVQAKKSLAA